jgi:hypothetical protein
MSTQVYYCIFLASILTSAVDIQVVHKNYDLEPFDKTVLFLHQVVIVYMVLGLTFTSRSEILTHLFSALIVMALWNHNGHCVLSQYMENSLHYKPEDHHLIIMDYPVRRKYHLTFFLPIIAIDIIKLTLLKT